MAAVDQFDQPRAVDMGIDLRRRDVGMAEQRLQHAQVGAARQQVRREGVAQDVRADPVRRDPGQRRPSRGRSGTGAPGSDATCRWETATGWSRAHARSHFRRRLGRARRDRHQPLLVALAAQASGTAGRRAPRGAEANQLGRAQARAVEQFEQRQVAQRQRLAARRPLLDRGEHRLDLVVVQDLRQRPLKPWPRQRRRRDRRSLSPRRAGSRRSAAAPPSAGPRSTAARSAQAAPSRPSSPSGARRRATADSFGRALQGRCDRRQACCATRPLPPPSCRRSDRPAPDRPRSRPRQRLGGDHPRQISWPVRLKALTAWIQIDGRTLVEVAGAWKPLAVRTSDRAGLPALPRRRSAGSSRSVRQGRGR